MARTIAKLKSAPPLQIASNHFIPLKSTSMAPIPVTSFLLCFIFLNIYVGINKNNRKTHENKKILSLHNC